MAVICDSMVFARILAVLSLGSFTGKSFVCQLVYRNIALHIGKGSEHLLDNRNCRKPTIIEAVQKKQTRYVKFRQHCICLWLNPAYSVALRI
ncbi:hypothetical protein SAMN05216327_11257 [Dyadobacter sp. SG02]|nr:hypothetical protein SAMN05216327_11257 [Dyadobacter sp. SG02]